MYFGGQSWFSLFGGASDSSTGIIDYRIKSPPSPRTNLQCLILGAFPIPRFEYTQFMVITYRYIAREGDSDRSHVCNTTN